MSFGQVVIGPPGSGKSTYCNGLRQFLTAIGREVAVINLDPANDAVPYECDLDINQLISLADVMDNLQLGPNGGLLYCMEYLEQNMAWLRAQLSPFRNKYLLFDLPGQVELYTHHTSIRNIVQQLTKWNFRLAAVHLVDAHHITDPAKFISVVMVSLSTMCHLELPHINVLSKMDIVEQYGQLQFRLNHYTDVLDLESILSLMASDPMIARYKKLNEEIVGVIESYNLVAFHVLAIQDKESVDNILKVVDKATGYVFRGRDAKNVNLSSAVISSDGIAEYQRNLRIEEKYLPRMCEPSFSIPEAPNPIQSITDLKALVGERVRLHGLKAKPLYNGLVGMVTGIQKNGNEQRLVVNVTVNGSVKKVCLKPQNLLTTSRALDGSENMDDNEHMDDTKTQ